jgi:hypothetical protein
MTTMPPLDADALKRLLAGIQYPPAAIAEKFRAVYDDLQRQSPRIRSGDFAHLAAPDLALLFDLYDCRFFNHGLQRLLDAEGCPLLFRTSRRLTRSAGTTTRFLPRRLRGDPMPTRTTRYEIAVSTTLLFQTFADVQRPVRVNGLLCQDRIEALLRIFEHELLHLLEMLLWTKSSCAAPRFKALAWGYFGHTETKHDLVTQDELATNHFGVRRGDRVSFDFEGVRRIGVVNRITRRATILVESPDGVAYTDGKRYRKFYVPLAMLEKAPALSP